MGDLGDYWRDVKPIMKTEADKQREAIWQACEAQEGHAFALARQNGLQVKTCGNQYNIKHGSGWIIQFYPGNGRLFRSGKGRAPFLHITAEPITLLDVVRACIEAEVKP